MFLIKEGKIIFPVKATFTLLVVSAFFIVSYSHNTKITHLHQQCELISKTAATLFTFSLDKALPINDNIEGMIMATNGDVNGFENIIPAFIPQTPSIMCIQLAPKGKPSQFFPQMPEDKIIPDLYNSPYTKKISYFAEINRKSYLSGPYSFDKNEPILILQDPVFLRTKKIQGEFWGFCTAYIKINDLFDQDTLNYLNYSSPPCSYKLYKFDPNEDKEVLLSSNTDEELINPVITRFNVKESSWVLYVVPKNGWYSPSRLFLISIILFFTCVIISILIGFLVTTKDRNENLEKLTFMDPLTALYNARKFTLLLKQYQKLALPYTIIYLDLNNFKMINDNLGHDTGDKILTIVARKISNCIREGDLAFRLGGDEFTIILPGEHDENFVKAVIERLKESIKRETVLETARMQVTASIGFARCPQDSSDYEEVVKIADKHMYKDKRLAHSKEKL